MGDAGIMAQMVGTGGASLEKQSIPGWKEQHWAGQEHLGGQSSTEWTENHQVDRASLQDDAAKEETLAVLPLFEMQLCKGHRGGDETRSCNKEGEIKNNDRNKLS